MDIALVGGGLCGPLAAIFLARRGHAVTVYERRRDPRLGAAGEGRSVNLALSQRGIDALRRIGLEQAVLARSIPMRGRSLHGRDGEVAYQSYSADGTKAINSVSRGALNDELLGAAERTAGVTVLFEQHVESADTVGDRAVVTVDADGVRRTIEHDIAIGTDGVFSAVRERIVHSSRTDYHQESLPWGYKELTIPASTDGDYALEPNALHIWPRSHSMMIALPNPDHSFTATLFWPFDGDHGFADLVDSETILARFSADYADAVPLMPSLVGDFLANPIGNLVTVRLWPWTLGRLAVLGDAAHAIVPFYGQGMNCAFEDIVEFDRCLDDVGDDVLAAVARCAERRKPNADAIAEMALENFVEMRDRVASPWFRLAKKAEHGLERLAPRYFVSLYERISFSTMPYAEARQHGRRRRLAIDSAVRTLDTASASLRHLVGRESRS